MKPLSFHNRISYEREVTASPMMSDRVISEPDVNSLDKPTRVLVIVGTYLPGVKGGGHIRSIAALVENLSPELEFFITCNDRDAGDSEGYPGIISGEWAKVGKASVLYLGPKHFTAQFYRHLLDDLKPDVVYLNTVFSYREVLLPAVITRWMHGSVRLVVAPRGCLDPGALSLKSIKKRIFLRLLRISRLARALIWQASTEMEASFIKEAVGSVRTVVASNVPSNPPRFPPIQIPKRAGGIRIVFLSRISRKKNLLFLLERLATVRGEIELTIAGPVEDHGYWLQCKEFIDGKLGHLKVDPIGTVQHDEVVALLASHHIFALPTLGENFGHVILEACDAGLGVLISDRTPWRGLEALGAGRDLSLDDPEAWESILQAFSDMDDADFQKMSVAARSVRSAFLDLDVIKRANLALFSAGLPSAMHQ